MDYSEKQLRRVLAVVRVLVGVVYVCFGYEKLFDPEFFQNGFMQRLDFWQTAVASPYRWAWEILAGHPGRWAVLFGGVEMFIGVALVLGLATRPASAIGILYVAHRFLLSWFPTDTSFTLWRFFEIHFEQIASFCLFWVLIVGHAGDVWGLGAIYHRRRLARRAGKPRKTYDYFGSEDESAARAKDASEANTESLTGT